MIADVLAYLNSPVTAPEIIFGVVVAAVALLAAGRK